MPLPLTHQTKSQVTDCLDTKLLSSFFESLLKIVPIPFHHHEAVLHGVVRVATRRYILWHTKETESLLLHPVINCRRSPLSSFTYTTDTTAPYTN